MATTETRLPDVVPATDLGKEKPSTPGSSSNQKEVVDVVLDESIDVNPAAAPAATSQSSSPPSPSLLSQNNPPLVQIWSHLDSATELNDLEDQAHHPLVVQHQRHQRRVRHRSSSQHSDPGGYCFSDSGIDSQIASPIAFGSCSTGAEETGAHKPAEGQGRPAAAAEDNEGGETFHNPTATLHLTVPSKNRAAVPTTTGQLQQPPPHRTEKHPPQQKLIRQSQLTWHSGFFSSDSTEGGGQRAASPGSAEIDDAPDQDDDNTIASGSLLPAITTETPSTRSVPLLPKTRNHGNYKAIDHGMEVWCSQDDAQCNVTAAGDQQSIVGASPWPTIRIQQSAEGGQCRTRYSLDESNPPPLTVAAGRLANRLSLDERKVLAEAHVHHPQQVLPDSDPSSSSTLTRTDTVTELSSAGLLIPELRDKLYWKTGSSSSDLTDENGGDLSSGQVSRRPSFGSIRSECGTEAASGPVGCSLFGATDHHRHRANSSEAKQLSRLLSSSSSKSLFLSVPPRVYNAMWPAFSSTARSQPASPSRLHHSFYLDSMTSIASRHSLTKSLSSAGGSPYIRLSSSPNMSHPHAIAAVDRSSLVESSHFIDMVNDHFGICDYATYGEEHGEPPSAVLSLTQRLAFPELVADEYSHRATKNRYGHSSHIETESNLNFFAKIITFLVLVFVVVLVAGVLVKLYHTPR